MKTHRLRQSVVLAVALMPMPSSPNASAATLVVTNLASLGPGTLRQALSDNIALGGGNTIVFSNVAGTITLQGELSVLAPVTILGPGTNVIAVNGNNSVRGLTVTAGPTFISDLTIRNGRAIGGPGQGGQPNGQDGLGGGIYNLNSALTLSNCVLLSNSVVGGVGADRQMATVGRGGKGLGGGVANVDGTLSLIACVFSGNQAIGGRGGFAMQNTAGLGGDAQGGAIFTSSGPSLISACNFLNNQTVGGLGGGTASGVPGSGGQGYGGGIYSVSPLVIISTSIRGSTVSGGNAGDGTGVGAGTGYGGGIYSISSLSLFSSTIASNSAAGLGSDFGGGIFSGSDTGTTNCTVAFNQADTGGGIHGTISAANTIFAHNAGATGPDVNGTINSQDYNLIQNTNGTILLGITTHVITGQDPLLGPLQHNGGPSQTMALITNSPAIDQGKSFGFSSDQRGLARPYNLLSVANAPGGDGSDIGAYELIPTPQLNIQRAPNHNVVLSWSADAADFRLESATNLPAMDTWQVVTNARTYTANQAFVTNSASGISKLYRLILPATLPVP